MLAQVQLTHAHPEMQPMKTSLTLAAFLVLSVPAFAADGWKWLFDGTTIDGWEIKGGTATYKVEDGVIVGTTVEGSPNTFLCKGPFSDFELELDVLCDKPLNSGIQIRSHVYEKDTPQESNPKVVRKAGMVYGYQCETAAADQVFLETSGMRLAARNGWTIFPASPKPRRHSRTMSGITIGSWPRATTFGPG